MLNETIIIDRGLLGFTGGLEVTSFNDFRKYLSKYFGSTLYNHFSRYAGLSFSFYEIGGSKTVVNGFANSDDFLTFINNKYSDGSNYNSQVELTIYMDIDVKMASPTLYAKNSKIGQFKGRRRYRSGVIIEQDTLGSWGTLQSIDYMRRMWEDVFAEDLTHNFLLNHPEMKGLFWTKKDADKLGVCSAGMRIATGSNSSLKLYNINDSDPSTDTLVMSNMNTASINAVSVYVSTVTSPKYYIFYAKKAMDIARDQAFDWGVGVPVRELKNTNYSVVSVHGVQVTADLGSGIKTYRALKLDPVGVDTVYFDYIDETKYNVYSVTKVMNGNARIKKIDFNTDGLQRLGRIGNGDWLSIDSNDSTNQSLIKGVGDTHFVYQDKVTGKFSPLSESKMRQIKDLRFRIPFFSLVS